MDINEFEQDVEIAADFILSPMPSRLMGGVRIAVFCSLMMEAKNGDSEDFRCPREPFGDNTGTTYAVDRNDDQHELFDRAD
jgi:hypothetical protein